MRIDYKKIFSLISFTIAILLIILMMSRISWAAGTCTQSLAKTGDQAVLTFVCTADGATHTYPTTAISASNLAQIKGYYITEVWTLPGSPAPTDGTVILFNSATTPAVDLFGGVVTCGATQPNRFIPKLYSSTVLYGGASVFGAINLVVGSNYVNSAVLTVQVIMWRN